MNIFRAPPLGEDLSNDATLSQIYLQGQWLKLKEIPKSWSYPTRGLRPGSGPCSSGTWPGTGTRSDAAPPGGTSAPDS
jgi:hypothetical protein